jgi:hypothetical protein
MALAFTAQPAHAQVYWEDYQGRSYIGANAPGPDYENNGGTADTLANLRAISADVSNAARTGTSLNIDYNVASETLCNHNKVPESAVCLQDIQGRVLYAIVRFPVAGSYSFSLTHDAAVNINFSTDYTQSDFHNATYEAPVGQLGAWTANDTTFTNLPNTLLTIGDNRCALVRIYWNNVGGASHLRLRWTRPDTGGPRSFLPNISMILVPVPRLRAVLAPPISVGHLFALSNKLAAWDVLAVQTSSLSQSVAAVQPPPVLLLLRLISTAMLPLPTAWPVAVPISLLSDYPQCSHVSLSCGSCYCMAYPASRH